MVKCDIQIRIHAYSIRFHTKLQVMSSQTKVYVRAESLKKSRITHAPTCIRNCGKPCNAMHPFGSAGGGMKPHNRPAIYANHPTSQFPGSEGADKSGSTCTRLFTQVLSSALGQPKSPEKVTPPLAAAQTRAL